MLHLALAGAFLVLGLVHFATWAAVRSQRVQLWLLPGVLTSILLPSPLLRVAWSLLDVHSHGAAGVASTLGPTVR
jgi:hypothetical protein